MDVRARRRLAAGAALAVLALDLGDALLQPAPAFHPRSPAALALAALVGLGVLLLAPRIDSPALALGAGLAAGGALATVVSALAWSAGVPDPIVRGGYAFNLADLAIVAGDATLIAAALLHAWANRGRLRQRV